MNRTPFEYPPRVSLARTPTPLEPSRRIGKQLGVDLYFKRDDLTGVATSGNKIRKLEFSMADALSRQADVVITCGGVQSNHCRSTALAAAKLGLGCRLLLRVPDPHHPPAPESNHLLDLLLNAAPVYVTPEEYRGRAEIFEREAEALRKAGHRPYIIPEGASNAVGAWGYVRAFEELTWDLAGLGWDRGEPVSVVLATGSGGTAAGLLLGSRLIPSNVRLIVVNVCDDRDYFIREIGIICSDFLKSYRLDLEIDPGVDLDIRDGYVGLGYAQSRIEELALLRDVARLEGLLLDPVYTGKAFYGMVREMEKEPGVFGSRVVFLHTGGLAGLFPYAAQMAPML